jgi:hypothetical protein
LNANEVPSQQNPEKLVEAVDYLRKLENEDGGLKYPGFGTFRYVEAFIKREIQYQRNNESRKKRTQSNRAGPLVKREDQ